MTAARAALFALVLGCTANAEPPPCASGTRACDVDAGSSEDASDPSRDAAGSVDAEDEGDASVDAGDAQPDVGPRDGGWRADGGRVDAGGSCTLVPQRGCGSNQACRHDPEGGPTRCELAGTIQEHHGFPANYCRGEGGADLCAAGLFCQSWGECVRYCDPAGASCPPAPGGSEQWCRTGAGPAHCSFEPRP